MTTTAAFNLLQSAIDMIESKPIREWARSEHNAPIWQKIAENAYEKNGGDRNSQLRLSSYIMCVAIGA